MVFEDHVGDAMARDERWCRVDVVPLRWDS